MKRFVDLGTQLYCPLDENDPECWSFAWYCTVVDRFETFCDKQTWDSWEEFDLDFYTYWSQLGEDHHEINKRRERYFKLYPKDKP